MNKPENSFFDEQTDSSRIKANIVAKYFPQYCRIILKKPQQTIRYIDLFAGPGMYKDGNLSTPLLLAKACAEDSKLATKVHLMFNDNEHCETLKSNFYLHFPEKTFSNEPRFGDKTVGKDDKIHRYLITSTGAKNPHPTLLFVDPWGYKGIDTLSLAKFMENWGNELFLFVNIKRIHAAMENEKFDELMQALFPTSISELRKNRKYKATVYDRLSLIIENLASEFKKAVSGTLYHCSFKFQEEDSSATSHFIIHFTKHQKGFELAKQVYYEFDNIGATLDKDGNYTFDAKAMQWNLNPGLDFGDQNILTLSNLLSSTYKSRTISALSLFTEHHPQNKYCSTHYVKTLRYMVDKGMVKAAFKSNANHTVSVLLTEDCILEFL